MEDDGEVDKGVPGPGDTEQFKMSCEGRLAMPSAAASENRNLFPKQLSRARDFHLLATPESTGFTVKKRRQHTKNEQMEWNCTNNSTRGTE